MTKWKAEENKLRELLTGCRLTEQKKWGKPCFCQEDKNIAILQPMKEHLALMFFKGELLEDPKGILQAVGPNSRLARRILFTSPEQVDRLKGAIKALVRQAVAAEEAGLKLPKMDQLVLVKELEERLGKDRALKEAFAGLTPGRQRAYNLYFSDAKQASTRVSRIEKCAPKILAGRGLRD